MANIKYTNKKSELNLNKKEFKNREEEIVEKKTVISSKRNSKNYSKTKNIFK